MQPIFTVQYAEFKIAEYLQKAIKGSSAYIPMSPQEKDIDFLIRKFNENEKKHITCSFQVKMSRSYSNTKFKHCLWFKRFNVSDKADWYILVGICPENLMTTKNHRQSAIKWKEIIFAFTCKEMKVFLDNVRQKKNPQKLDSSFAFGFNDNKEIYSIRGATKDTNFSKYLIENRISEINQYFI